MKAPADQFDTVWREHMVSADDLLDVCSLVGHLADSGYDVDRVKDHLKLELDRITTPDGTAWDKQPAIPLDMSSKVRIDGKVYAFQGFTLQKFSHEWTQMDLEFAGEEEQEENVTFEVISVPDPDETVTVSTTKQYEEGKLIRTSSTTMVARAVRPERGDKMYG